MKRASSSKRSGGTPPRATRFKPGQSGNPAGRPKGRRNLATELAAELNKLVTVTESGRKRQLTKQTVLVKRMVADAMQGDARSREQLLRLAALAEAAPADAGPHPLATEKDAEILARFRADVLKQLKGEQS